MLPTSVLKALAAMLPFSTIVASAPATADFITDPAAATDAPAVPSNGQHVDSIEAASVRGQARVHNHCSFPAYVYVCNQNPPACTGVTTIQPGGTFAETYTQTTQDGRSIKIGKTGGEGAKPILQLEYTVAAGNTQVYFDASEVNGNPFGANGFTLTSSRGLSKHCPPPGDHNACPFVFNTPTDGTVFNVAVGDSIATTLCG